MLTVAGLQAQLQDLPGDAPVELSIGSNRAAAHAVRYDPPAEGKPGQVVLAAPGDQHLAESGRAYPADACTPMALIPNGAPTP